jgi:twinkle protein
MSRDFLRHEPCLSCRSSNNLAIYSDGYAKCFSSGCDYYTYDYFEEGIKRVTDKERDTTFIQGAYGTLQKRKLTEKTCRFWGCHVSKYKGKLTGGVEAFVTIFDYKNADGGLVAQKVRTKDKQFSVIGAGKELPLFGIHLWANARKNTLVITEGEYDAMAVSQTNGLLYPVVSIPNGCGGAVKAITRNLDWVESFDEVIIMFDTDTVGREAATAVAQVLSPGKAKIVNLPVKDANEMLIADRTEELRWAYKNLATPYRPDSIISFADAIKLSKTKVEAGVPYPWESLNKVLMGIRPREIITIGAGTGVGKTEFVAEVAAHFVKHKLASIGLFSFEMSSGAMALQLAGKLDDTPYHKPGTEYSQEKLDATMQVIEATGLVHLYDHNGSAEWDKVQHAIRYMHLVHGTSIFFIDNLTQLATNQEIDERLALEKIMSASSALVHNLGITIIFVSHLLAPEKGTTHEQGGIVLPRQFKGGRSIQQWSFLMLGIERNSLSENPTERNQITVRVVKDRTLGSTGQTFNLAFDPTTNRIHGDSPFEIGNSPMLLEAVEEEEEDAFV